MKRWSSPFFALMFLPLTANVSEKLKEEIAHYQDKLKTSKSDNLHYNLALAYYQDQEIDKSFQHFLLALKGMESKEMPYVEEGERKRYEEALQYYLNQSGADPICIAKELIERYGELNESNVELRLLMAIAYANLGQYDLFFKHFYEAYPYLKDSFLVYKTQGILYLRLSHRSRLDEERHFFQQAAFDHLTLALDRNAKDASLYKVLVFLAKDEKNDLLVRAYLQKIAENKVPIARGDIYLYVRESVRLGECELGQNIIDQASLLYDYSRAIIAAQEYLNQHRG